MSRPGIGQIRRGPKWGGTDKQNTIECGNNGCTVTHKHLPRCISIAEINPRTERWNNGNQEITRAMLYDWLLICDWAASKGKLLCPQCAGK